MNPNIPRHPLRFLSFWSINAPLDEARLCGQLDAMQADGFDGAVFHPRFYPNQPAYMSDDYLRILSRVILYARARGLAIWLYDENGWPSGTVGGELLRQYPEDAGSLLALYEGDSADAWHAFEHDGRRWHLRKLQAHGVDYLNPETCRHFLALVHDRYKEGLDPEAWQHVEAFFTDEPEFGLGLDSKQVPPHGAVMWSDAIPEWYAQRVGCDVRDDLPAVFFQNDAGTHEAIRIRFWEFMTDCLCQGFFAPYQAWCRREGKVFTGHLKGDEHPLFQVMMNGSCHQVFQYFDMPGIDPLERFPSCDFFARQVVSAAHQFGTGRAMAEVMGGGGWGSRPEDLERFLLWLANHGITDHVIHLNQYRLNSHAICDWPPSNPHGLNWRPAYAELLRRVRAKTRAEDALHADTLVVAPYRGIMAGYEPWSLPLSNIHNCAIYPDTAAGALNTEFLALEDRLPPRHHFVDERSLDEHGRVVSGRLAVGRHQYDTVILAEGCRLGPEAQRLVTAFTAAGGRVLTPDAVPPVTPPIAPAPIAATTPIRWLHVASAQNALLLEPKQDAEGGAWTCAFHVAADSEGVWTLEFADDIRSAELDGKTLTLRDSEEGGRVVLPALTAGRHALHFAPMDQDDGPRYVWLCGTFQVLSQSEWTVVPGDMLRTAGPWTVSGSTASVDPGTERVAAGWPFANEPVTVEGAFDVPHAVATGTRLCLQNTAADAAQVVLDETDLGWVWGPDWSVPLPFALAEGSHRLTLRLVPSTYNRFGPHHHYGGDRHVISCDQFTGKKNFADEPDAPDHTLDHFWRFRPVKPPAALAWREPAVDLKFRR